MSCLKKVILALWSNQNECLWSLIVLRRIRVLTGADATNGGRWFNACHYGCPLRLVFYYGRVILVGLCCLVNWRQDQRIEGLNFTASEHNRIMLLTVTTTTSPIQFSLLSLHHAHSLDVILIWPFRLHSVSRIRCSNLIFFVLYVHLWCSPWWAFNSSRVEIGKHRVILQLLVLFVELELQMLHGLDETADTDLIGVKLSTGVKHLLCSCLRALFAAKVAETSFERHAEAVFAEKTATEAP